MTDTSSIRREMADTRVDMTQTVGELEQRASEKVRAVKQRLDLGGAIREHPWPALSIAVALGAVIGASGADEKAAAATVAAAKKASRASVDAAKQAVEKVRPSHDEPEDVEALAAKPEKPGIVERLFDGLGMSVASSLDGVIDAMRVASRDWGARMANSSRPEPVTAHAPHAVTPSAMAPVAAAAIIVTHEEIAAPTPADAVPLPNEMAPAELGLRADAVEATGGGTHEPPLEPGAGQLGARWS